MSEFPITEFSVPRPFVPVPGSHADYTLGAAFQEINLIKNAKFALVQAVGQNVRMTFDGTNPTATSGFRIVADDPPFMIGLSSIIKLKVHREAAGAVFVIEFGE